MFIKQISVFVENRCGHIAEILDILAKNSIDISALSIADTTDFGVLRMIVNNPDLAEQTLKENGMAVKITEVLAIAVDDTPGGLLKALEALKKKDVTIEYMYAFVGKNSKKAMVVLRTDNYDDTIAALEADNIDVVTADDVSNM